MQFYEIGKTYDFEVLQTDDLSESFFRLLLNDGITEIRLPKIKFQQDKELPITLKCRVKAIDNEIPIVDHFIPKYVNDFYGKGAQRGEVFNFKVTGTPTRTGDPFFLRDEYGINYRLYEPGAVLSINQIVKCKFETLDAFKFILKLVNDGLQLPLLTLDEICDQLKIRKIERDFITNTLMSLPAMSAASEERTASNPNWPLSFLHSIERHLSEWFINSKVQRHNRAFRSLLSHYREASLFLLEGSNFLSNCDDESRHTTQTRLTDLIGAVEPYITTLKIIAEDKQEEFVEGLMDKLRKSGYLYQPNLQLAILMLIFRLFPEIIDSSLSRILDVIMGRRLSTWIGNDHTFSNAFVEQFEIYIRQARKAIDDLPQAESQDENHRLETIITAIALQLFMANPDAFPAFDRNMSLFYRYISLLRPVKNRDLLTKSIMSLLGVRLPINFSYDQIKEPMLMMTSATIMTPMAELSALPTIHTLQAGNISIRISKEGIAISRLDMPTNERVIPNGIMEWLHPQIYHKGISPIKSNKLESHNKWWREIEIDLFGARPTATNSQPIQNHRHNATIGEDVYVIVTGTNYDEKGNPILLCRIDEDDINPAPGYILREDIVGYRISQIPAQSYLNDRGMPYHFYARVINISPDGSYQFSLKEEIEQAIHSMVNYNDEYLAVITSDASPDYSAICSKGFGLYLMCNPNEEPYITTDKVKFRIVGTTPHGAYRGIIISDASEEDNIDNLRAFTHIMREIAYEPAEDEDYQDFLSDNESSGENFETLKKEEVREIIDIIRFKVVADKELVEAFDYLNFARLLALIIDEKEIAEVLSVYSSLLIMHEYFATNSRVDSEKLMSYSDIAQSNPHLNILYKRLEIVSWLGDKYKINDLLTVIKGARNELEATLARMVLSYNMVVESETTDSEIADSIKSKIKKLLRVNSETRQLKYYGSESLYVEFKSSIVYPARHKGEKPMPNPEQQQFIILRVIASFLNAGGGTLYIGVNDSTHYESGLQADFEYYKTRHAQVGTFVNKIKDVDNVAVFLANLVHYKFGDTVSRLVDIAPDNDATKAVVVVKVKQSLDPVKLNDAYYERQSSTIRELRDPEEQRKFIAERKALKMLQLERIKAAEKSALVDYNANSNSTEDSTTTEKIVTVESGNTSAEQESTTNDKIATSTWRHNVLHDYQDNFVAPQAYIYFDNDSNLKYSLSDDYEETTSKLTLIVGDNERDAYLLLIYAGELAIKVSIQEIFNLSPRELTRLYKEAPLVYASIVHANDGLLSVHTDGRDALWQRVTPIKKIASGHVGSTPNRILDVAVKSTLLYETVDSTAMPSFAKSMPGEIRTNDIGFNMHRKIDSGNAKDAIDNLIAACISTQKNDA